MRQPSSPGRSDVKPVCQSSQHLERESQYVAGGGSAYRLSRVQMQERLPSAADRLRSRRHRRIGGFDEAFLHARAASAEIGR